LKRFSIFMYLFGLVHTALHVKLAFSSP
jgi:hypothetical protein